MKTILITGANRGIGLELVRQLTSPGNRILATCRNPELAVELQQLSRDSHDNIEVLPLDVDRETSIVQLSETLRDRGETINLLFNNAGIIDWRNMREIDAETMQQVYKINVIGAMLVLRAFVPHLKQAPEPMVINLSSRLGSIALRGRTELGGAIAYSASKAGLNMLTKQASIDLADDGISVIAISPGWVRTDMGGPKAKYSVEESVKQILCNVDRFTSGDSGKFFGEDGKEIPF